MFALISGLFVPILLLVIHNYMAFGSILKTAYNLPESRPEFGLHFFLKYADQYLLKLMNEGVGILFLPGLAGLIYLSIRNETRETGLLILLTVVPVTIVYLSYCWPPDLQSMRFLLPTLPLYVISGVLFIKPFLSGNKSLRNTVLMVIIGITIFTGTPSTIKRLQSLNLNNKILADITLFVEKNIKPGSVIIAPEGINQHLDLLGKWKLADPNILHTSLNPLIAGPIGAIPSYMRCRNDDANLKYVKFRSFLGKNVHNVFAYDVWNWAGDTGSVYIIGYEQQVDYFRQNIPPYHRITEDARMELLPYLTSDTTHFYKPGPFSFSGYKSTVIYDFYINGQPLLIASWKKENNNEE